MKAPVLAVNQQVLEMNPPETTVQQPITQVLKIQVTLLGLVMNHQKITQETKVRELTTLQLVALQDLKHLEPTQTKVDNHKVVVLNLATNLVANPVVTKMAIPEQVVNQVGKPAMNHLVRPMKTLAVTDQQPITLVPKHQIITPVARRQVKVLKLIVVAQVPAVNLVKKVLNLAMKRTTATQTLKTQVLANNLLVAVQNLKVMALNLVTNQ